MKKKQNNLPKPRILSVLMQIAYWCFFIILSLFLQFFISGIDVMVVGLLISLPERKFFQTAIMFCIFICIQEATGILTFGLLLLEYSLVVVAFFLGRIIFAVGTFSFVLLLSLFISVIHFILIQIFSAVQGLYVEQTVLLYNALIECVIVPIIWYPMYSLYKRCMERGNTI